MFRDIPLSPSKCSDYLKQATTATFFVLSNTLLTIIMPFDSVQSELLPSSLNKQYMKINKERKCNICYYM